MKPIYLKSIQEIKDAVNTGKTVYADSALYKVIKDKNNNYLIKASTGYCIGLHGQEGTAYENVLNAKEFWYMDNN